MGRNGSGGTKCGSEMVLGVLICGQKWFWWHDSVGRNGTGGTIL